DVVDCSSGGFDGFGVRSAPLYQVPFARAVREAGIRTMAVGLIMEAKDAETVVADGSADLVAFGRTALDDPNWPIHAARVLAPDDYSLWPIQAGYRMQDLDKVLARV